MELVPTISARRMFYCQYKHQCQCRKNRQAGEAYNFQNGDEESSFVFDLLVRKLSDALSSQL